MSTVREEYDLICPQCGSDEHLSVELTTMAYMTPEGTDPFGDQEWDHNCYMRCINCINCGNDGTVCTFYFEKVEP